MTDLLQSLLAWSLPPMPERERYTYKTAPTVLVATFPLLLASFVRLRYPDLHFFARLIILLAGLPIVSHFLLKRYYVAVWYDAFDGTPYSINHLNFVCGMAIGVIALKFIELLFLERDSDFEVKGWEEYSREQGKDGPPSKTTSRYTLQRPALFPGTVVPLEIDLVSTIRGQGYNWGAKESHGGYKAIIEAEKLAQKPEYAREQKWIRVRKVGLAALTNLVIIDACDSIVKNANIFPAASRLGGGDIVEAANGSLGSIGPLVVTVATGVLIFVALQADYAVGYLMHLLVTPASQIPIVVGKWDPLPFNRPYAATSLSDFWSKHWHGFVRRTFTVFAYKPVLKFSSRLALPSQVGQTLALVATFALSGLLHEGCLEGQAAYYYDRELQHNHGHLSLRAASATTQQRYGFGAKSYATTYAFTIQALLLMLETFWLGTIEPQVMHLVTGRKDGKVIHGWLRSFLGWIWTYSCMVYSGSYITDVWHSHGLTNATASLRLIHRTSAFIYRHLYH